MAINENDFTWERLNSTIHVEVKDGFELSYYNTYYHYKHRWLPTSEPRKEYIIDDNYKAWHEHQMELQRQRAEIARMW
jgi:hypothetical protein